MEDKQTLSQDPICFTPGFSSQEPSSFKSWSYALPSYMQPSTSNLPHIISIGGGKGGVGKSLISANLATKLASRKKRVILVDLDIGSSNLHTYLSVGSIKYHLSDFLKQNISFSNLLSATLSYGVAFIPGDKDLDLLSYFTEHPEISQPLWANLFASKKNYGVDYIILDLGAGNLQCICDFFALSHLGILTAIPEPSSIENTYSFLKTFIYSVSSRVLQNLEAFSALKELQHNLQEFVPSRTYNYLDYIEDLIGSDLASCIKSSLDTRMVAPLLNETRQMEDIKIAEVLSYNIRHYFGLNSQSVGHIPYDDVTWKNMRKKGLLVKDFPFSKFSKGLDGVAENISNYFSK